MNPTDRIPQPVSPLPWKYAGKDGALICNDPSPKSASSSATREYYGGDPICESMQKSDRDFILAAVEPYNPLPDDLLEKFVVLEHRRRKLEADLDDTKKAIAEIQEPLQEEWGERGVSQVKMDGLTVHLKTLFYCGKRGEVETAAICTMLKQEGLGSMVKLGYVAASVKARVKEWVDRDKERKEDEQDESHVPDEIKRCFRFGETTSVASRRS